MSFKHNFKGCCFRYRLCIQLKVQKVQACFLGPLDRTAFCVFLSNGTLRIGPSFILPEEGVSHGNIIVKMLCFNLTMKVQIMYNNNNNNNNSNNNNNNNNNNNTQLIFSQFSQHLSLPSVIAIQPSASVSVACGCPAHLRLAIQFEATFWRLFLCR